MIKVIPFQIEHFDQMEIAEDSWLRRENRPLFENYAKLGPAITIVDGDKLILSGGIACGIPGTGDCWMITSKYVSEYPKTTFKEGLSLAKFAFEKLKLHRLQATILETDKTAIRWVEKFKFVREGLMRCFGPDKKNYYLYARINI